jgi:hypothetical protein
LTENVQVYQTAFLVHVEKMVKERLVKQALKHEPQGEYSLRNESRRLVSFMANELVSKTCVFTRKERSVNEKSKF